MTNVLYELLLTIQIIHYFGKCKISNSRNNTVILVFYRTDLGTIPLNQTLNRLDQPASSSGL